MHGDWLESCAATGNPCRQAFEDWGVAGRGRSYWDPIAVMIAVRGVAGIHCKELGQGGHQSMPTGREDGKEKWVNGASSNSTFVHYTRGTRPSALSSASCSASRWCDTLPTGFVLFCSRISL